MARPKADDWTHIKHLMRYLKGKRRAVQWFAWDDRGRSATLEGYSDSDWAGCQRTRKSTTGGCIRWNGHLLKSWSKTQSVVATSSGEAELYAATRCGGELLGLQSIARDLGVHVNIELRVDANATIGTLHRRGIGRLRHVEVADLWMQDVVKNKRIILKKVLGKDNPADLMTKYLAEHEILKHMTFLNFEFVQ